MISAVVESIEVGLNLIMPSDLPTLNRDSSIQKEIIPIKARDNTRKKIKAINLPIFFLPTQLLIHVQ